MYRKFLAAFAVVALGFVFFPGTGQTAPPKWIDTPNGSCDDVCTKASLHAVSAGTNGGQQFWVCSANANGDGWRAGWNLRPKYADVCNVAWGDKEMKLTPYRCLCE